LLAAAIIGCVAPPDAEGLDWFDGMAPPRVEELQAARQGAEVLEAYLRQRMASLTFADAHDVSLALGGTLSPIDVSVLNGPFGEPLLRSVRRAAESGIGGWVDDEIALVNPWGFDVRSITQPIAVCQGGEDKITPLAHGNWIVDHIPGAQRRWLLSEGHLSPLHLFETIVQDLIAQAGGARVIRPAPN
jgi:pimeloyl-ACP methyl ester carboxylesterase